MHDGAMGRRRSGRNGFNSAARRRGVLSAAVERLEPRRLLASATNLLPNPTVETGTGGVPDNWTWNCVNGSAANWTEAQLLEYYAHTGNHNPKFNMGRATSEWVQDGRAFVGTGALSLTSVAPNRPDLELLTWYGMQPVDGYWLSGSMPATAGTSYVASAWLNRSIKRDGEPWLGPLEIRFYNGSGAQISIPNGSVRGGIFSKLPANPWTYAPTMPYVAPTGAVTMKLRFGQEFQADTGGDGTMIADNLAVWALPDTLPLSVRRPSADYLMGNVPNFIHWFRDATASTQPPALTFPADTTTFPNTWATVENAVTGNLYYSKTTGASVDIYVTNLLGSLADHRDLSLQITRTNWLGVADPVINIPAQAVYGFGTTIFSANLTPTNSYGAFYLNVNVMQGSSVVGSTTGRYAVLPPLNRPDTVKNIWGVTSGFESPIVALSDVFKNATGTGTDVRTLNGTAGQNLSGTLTPTGDTLTYTVHHQGSTAFNVSLTAKQNAVGGQAGLVLANNTGQSVTATSGGFYTAMNIAAKMGWSVGSITADQVKTLVLGFDYLSSGFANPVSAGLYVTHTSPVGGLTEFYAAATLAAASTQTHKAVFLNEQSQANLQAIADFLNANGGVIRIKFFYSGNLNAGASLAAADLSILSASAKTQENGRLTQIAGFGLAWVRLYNGCDNFANATGIAEARTEVEWYRHLGLRVVLQIYGSSTFTSPVNFAAVKSAGQSIAREFKDIVAAIGNWGVEQSNHRTPADPVYRPFDQNGVMMDDATYDTIAANLYDGMKSVAPALPVLVGNIATADADNKRADTVLRMYQGPVNGKFDGAILNIYHNQNGMPNVTVEAFDRYGDTQSNIWIEENADSDVAIGPTGENVGANNMVRWRVTQAAKFDGRVEAITQWMFGNGVSPEHSARDMLTQALQPRPQYVAQAVMTDALSDATFVGDHSTYNTTPPNGAGGWDYPTNDIYEWRRSDGSSLWIVRGSGSQSFGVTGPNVTVMDLMGNTRTIAATNNTVSVSLGSSPVYIFNGGIITHSRPIVPANLIAVGGDGKITLNWTASPGATSYNIYRGAYWSGLTTTTADYPQIASGITGTTFTDTGRQPGVLYYYRITAVKSGVESGKSNEASTFATLAPKVYLQTTDALGSTSFTSGANWSDTLIPHAGSDYYNQTSAGGAFTSIRTPGSGATATFGGDSLHLVGFATGGSLHLKGPDGQVVTIDNLYMENGATISDDGAALNYTLNGKLTINSGTAPIIYSVGAGKTLLINSTISGAGPLTFARNGGTGSIAIGSTNNTLSGLVRITNVPISVAGDLSLGIGNITLDTAARLTLTGGATNNYIGDLANLSVATGTTVNLNFTGADYVGSVTINGVTYTSGTFDASHASGIFTGAGRLVVSAPKVTAPATATPNPVGGTTAALSVLADDDGGEASLIYTWVAIGTPPAPVTFSANGTNAAKNTTATFAKAGSYSFQVTITDGGGLTTTSSVNVMVVGSSIYMSASDDLHHSSFTETVRWPDGQLPHLMANYYNQPSQGSATYTSIRTPETGLAVTFGGESLHLMGDVSGVGTLHLKGPDGQIITINNLYMENGATINSDAITTKSFILAGSLIINDGIAPVIYPVGAGRTFTINSSISGTGPLTFAGAASPGTTVIGSVNNTLSGLVRLTSNVSLRVAGDLSMGIGNIAMDGTSALTLQNGATNNYIADSANLKVARTNLVNLNFTGTDYVGSITIDGVAYYSGTFGPIGSGADYESAIFTGIGSLTAVNTAPAVSTAAAASPIPVTGTSATLTVLGTDDAPESNLAYFWDTVGTPPAPVTFSANGTNAAKSTIATFTAPGTYNFRVLLSDITGAGQTTPSFVTVTVNQTVTSITVSPVGAGLPQGASQQYAATAFDQFGAVMSAPISWTATGGAITSGGMLTAGNTAGNYSVTASSGTASGSAAYTVFTPVPSAVTLRVNDGNVQRSMVKSLTLTFDQAVSLPLSALTLSRRGGTAGITMSISPSSGFSTTYVLTFTVQGIADSSLPDGGYTLVLNAASIKDVYNQNLSGGNRTFSFHRLFGDINGDRVVNSIDAAAFKSAMNKPVGSLWYMNYNNDLIIDQTDYLQMRSRMITPLL